MQTGILYGVSVGPGDPQLLTLRAAHILSNADYIAAPNIGSSARTALQIVQEYIKDKPIIDCTTPMTNDQQRTGAAYDAIADDIAGILEEGHSVAFVTLGDASVYSTWSYLCQRMQARGFQVEVVPGVTSFCAAAATLAEPLCERDEQLVVVPASTGDVDAALHIPGTKVFMKSGKHVQELRDQLAHAGLADRSSMVVNCGLSDEETVPNLAEPKELPQGMSIVITKGTANHLPTPDSHDGTPHPALQQVAQRIAPPSEQARQASIDKWNAVAKPIGSLGVLEDDITAIAALTGTAEVCIDKRAVVVFCADNGVVAQGVTQCGSEVTRAVAVSLGKGISSVCTMAHVQHIHVEPVDIGMFHPSQVPGCANSEAFPAPVPGVRDCVVAQGTGDISCGPAMTRDQALQALQVGIDVAGDLKNQGYQLLVSGEMGIGNTTTSSAVTAALLGLDPQQVTGRGAGLDDEGLQRKVDAIRRALQVNKPNPHDALDVLAKVGGFDIAGIAGLFIGGALHRIPVVIDGYISALSAYVASMLVPSCTQAMLASHLSAEPAAQIIMQQLGLRAPIQAGMRLGEGTGGICLVPMLDMTLALYNGTTFADSGIDAYDPDINE